MLVARSPTAQTNRFDVAKSCSPARPGKTFPQTARRQRNGFVPALSTLKRSPAKSELRDRFGKLGALFAAPETLRAPLQAFWLLTHWGNDETKKSPSLTHEPGT